MPLQVIGAGLGRTGTQSLGVALELLGYRTHRMVNVLTDPTQDPGVWLRAKENPSTHKDEWESVYGNYDAAISWPTVTFYKELMDKYPDAKVILTLRDANEWFDLMLNTIFTQVNFQLPINSPHHLNHAVEMLKTVILDGQAPNPFDAEADRAKFIKMYNDHIEEVKKHVPAERMLIMNLNEGWDRLCTFLNKPVPDTPYPALNYADDFGTKFYSLLEQLNDNLKKLDQHP
ncbi:P-loop containing nucleoside triphosphate hydrolase protein [Absidia repens]|uniref:p-loop containing nucleoside triphosphate hydrolase protein n=1 Tax=Absidia repens TaxID=90262 RepID=A0A1X2IUX6_9FUNG|nr:P-loop containing nucleoside triphosphate hydrolase protein [Absidia repens]